MFRIDLNNECMFVSCYVDDGLISTSSMELYYDFLRALRSEFTVSQESELKYYLGVEIDYDLENGTLKMSQGNYLRTLLTRFNMSACKHAQTPSMPGEYLTGYDCPSTPNRHQMQYYQQVIGALLYAACYTRPDIAYGVNQCA
mmetsp:Transcript_37031/g.93014  ORF Transcript_37031/g.93014 Transcript_37031/m.93014 type:complete len:143 (+) Transcript_37031:1878-2306(+)